MRLFFFFLCTEWFCKNAAKIQKGNGESAEDKWPNLWLCVPRVTEWPRITAASLLTVTNYEKAWQGDLNLFIRLRNTAVEKRKIPGVNKSFYKLKIHNLGGWKLHIFLIKPCWLPCRPSRLPLMYTQQLWIIDLFLFQDAGPWMDRTSRSYMIILGNIWQTLRQLGVGLPESLEL